MRLSCSPYGPTMQRCLRSSRIPTRSGYLLGRGENTCWTLPCILDLRCCACTSPTSALTIACDAARSGVGPTPAPMRFLYVAPISAVDFLCGSSPLMAGYENNQSFAAAFGRHRRPLRSHRRRLPEARRGADRDRSPAGGPPRPGHRRDDRPARLWNRLGRRIASSPNDTERKQQCSTSS